jgi:hypothetical protein
MEKIKQIKQADLLQTQPGVEVYSVDYELSKNTKEEIVRAKKVLNNNPFLKSVTILFTGELEQYNSTLHDEDRQLVDDYEYFIMDVEEVIIYYSGATYFRGYYKWDSSQYIEFKIEL